MPLGVEAQQEVVVVVELRGVALPVLEPPVVKQPVLLEVGQQAVEQVETQAGLAVVLELSPEQAVVVALDLAQEL